MADRSPNPAPHTIGFLEESAGIGPTHDERFAFWRQFSHLGAGAFDAAVKELNRMAYGDKSQAARKQKHGGKR